MHYNVKHRFQGAVFGRPVLLPAFWEVVPLPSAFGSVLVGDAGEHCHCSSQK